MCEGFGLFVCLMGVGADRSNEIAASSLALHVMEQLRAVRDLRVPFSAMKEKSAKDGPQVTRFKGDYFYRSDGHEAMIYTESAPGAGESVWHVYLTPSFCRRWRKDGERISGTESQVDLTMLRLPWAPGRTLTLSGTVNPLRELLASNNIAVRDGEGGALELVFPVRDSGPKPFRNRVIVVGREGMRPMASRHYEEGVVIQEIRIGGWNDVAGVYLPTGGVYEQFDGGSTVMVRCECQFDLSQARVNQGIEASEFDKPFPPGARVMDHRRNATYVAGAAPPPATSAKNRPAMKSPISRAPRGVAEYRPQPPAIPFAADLSLRSILLCVGVLMVAVGIAARIPWRRMWTRD